MFNTLFSKLAATLLVLFLFVGAAFVALMRYSFDNYQQEINQKLNATLAQELGSRHLGMTGRDDDIERVRHEFAYLMLVNPSIEVYLLDTAGNILAYSAHPSKVVRNRIDLRPVHEFLRGAAYPILGDDPRDPERRKIFSVAPVAARGERTGFLYVILGGEKYDQVAHDLRASYILRQSSGLMALAAGLALVVGFIVVALLTGRLKRLTAAVEAFRRGEFDSKILFAPAPKGQGDEIDRIGRAFRQMAEQITHQMRQLQQTDASRRDMIANVSHDLRTPIASLRGYLETLLLKEGSLTPDERRIYLEIAAKQSEHLSTLVAELFELAKLDAKDVQLHPEPFQISELVQDVLQKFQLGAQKQGIRLKADIGPESPFVWADLGLVERVLENLVENALRHTAAGGEICVSVAAGAEQTTVRIADTGSGIPETELPFIFDRFYRVEKSRTPRAGGAGLGLAITKRILDLHGSRIEVASAPGLGTTFSFGLPTKAPAG